MEGMATNGTKKNALVIRLKEQNRKRPQSGPMPGEPTVKSKVVDCRGGRSQDDVVARSMREVGLLEQHSTPTSAQPGNEENYSVVDEFVPDYEEANDSDGEVVDVPPPKLDCFPKDKQEEQGNWQCLLKKRASCQTDPMPQPIAAKTAEIRDAGTSTAKNIVDSEVHDLGAYVARHKKTGSNSLKGSSIGTFTLIQKCAVFRGTNGNPGKIVPMEWLAGFDEIGELGEVKAQGLGFEVQFSPQEDVMPCVIKETSG